MPLGEVWCKPSAGSFKINVNGSCSTSQNAYGVLVQDAEGMAVDGSTRTLSVYGDSTVTEVAALTVDIRLAIDLQLPSVW
ncbi:hypothetical protein F3Y22_tig00110392pilonHSYRG00106 [Hibiscus syriacus]|uniref:Uncharacterized protein n=1 Tax=Hibiscus syriacus TaxID=106335 RepID=A0A6A3APF1_HIBSY|nr:hypothetical protein F3Y22_tig00110392pilonHSYRG00106 [Hibiscus syriacus]